MKVEDIAKIVKISPEVFAPFDEGLYILDKNWRYVYVSQQAEKLTGKTREEFLGQELWQLFPNMQEQPVAVTLHKAMREHTREQLEVFDDSGQKWFIYSCYPLDEGLVVAVRDITTCKLMNEQLNISNARLNLVLNAINLGQWYGDLLKQEMVWSDTCKIHSGLALDEKESIGALYAHIHPKDREAVRRAMAETIQNHTEYNVDYRTIAADGRQRWVRAIGRCCYDEQGTPLHFDGITMDITEQKEFEERLRTKAALINLCYDAIIVHNYEGKVLFWNMGAEELYKWSAVEAENKVIHLLLKTQFPYSLDDIRGQILREGRWEGELMHCCKDGSRIVVDSRWSMLRNIYGQDIVFLEANRDVTERKELEQRKNEFISMASHELKTPITTIKALNQLVGKRLQPLGNQQIDHFLRKMDTQINRLLCLVNELLDISRLEEGKLSLHKEWFDLDKLVRMTVDEMQMVASHHKLIYKENGEVMVYGDRVRIEQVMVDLLNNAIKYSPRADRVLIHVSTTPETVTVSIQDFGIGIDSSKQQKIFERFYQAEPLERRFPGLGIGLYICREIIQRHNGQMNVESKLGEGATFSFTLPRYTEMKAMKVEA